MTSAYGAARSGYRAATRALFQRHNAAPPNISGHISGVIFIDGASRKTVVRAVTNQSMAIGMQRALWQSAHSMARTPQAKAWHTSIGARQSACCAP